MERKYHLIAIFATVVFVLPSASTSQHLYLENDRIADDVPNPFVIGNVKFVYDRTDFSREKEAITDLRKLLPPDRVVLHAAPSWALKKLLHDQLGSEQMFAFAQATFANYGRKQGYVWVVTWDVVSKTYPIDATIRQYVAVVAGDGAIIEPRRFLYDSYPGWGVGDINSILSFAKLEAEDKDANPLFGEAILDIANERMKTFADECQANPELKESEIPALVSRLKFLDQKLMHIPIRDTNTSISSRSVWAVRFIDEQIAEDEKKLARPPTFSVWVTPTGEVGDLTATPWDDGYEESEAEAE